MMAGTAHCGSQLRVSSVGLWRVRTKMAVQAAVLAASVPYGSQCLLSWPACIEHGSAESEMLQMKDCWDCKYMCLHKR